MDGASTSNGKSHRDFDEESKYTKTATSYEDLSVVGGPYRSSSHIPNEEHNEAAIEETEGKKAPSTELTGWRLAVVVASLCSAVFCVALDNTSKILKESFNGYSNAHKLVVLSVAIPRITDAFNTIDDIGWYGTAYFLTICSKWKGVSQQCLLISP